MTTYSSKDFHKVPGELRYQKPQRALIHENVLGKEISLEEKHFQAQRRHIVKIVDLPSNTLSMTLGELEPGEMTRRHRHNYETLIYVLTGLGKSYIEDEEIEWRAGDAFYVPRWAWHRHLNLSDEVIRYIACEDAPLLQHLGIALREEG